MKNTKRLTTLARGLFCSLIFGIITSSCVNEVKEKEEPGNPIPIVISAQVQQSSTRVTDTNFEKNDEIGLYAMIGPSEIDEERFIDNTRFRFASNTGFQPDKQLYFEDGSIQYDFISYYPYKEHAINKNESVMAVEVHTDQSKKTQFSKSDFLVAERKSITPSTDVIELIFEHKLYQLNIQVMPGKGYTAQKLLEANPTVIIRDVYTKANYDFKTDKISDLDTKADIIPYGDWIIEDGKLVGKTAILIPQTLDINSLFIELTIDDKYFHYILPENYTLEKGKAENYQVELSPVGDAVRCVISASIEGWGVPKKKDVTATEASPLISINSLTFAKSNVYRVMNKGKQVAEICKEYLLSETIDNEVIVIYPVIKGKTDLQNGIVAKFLDESGNVGGRISWNKEDNTFNYNEGNMPPIQNIYITQDEDITFIRPDNPLELNLKPDILTDVRGTEIITYPIVKIGTQYWQRSNLKATKYSDGTAIPKMTGFNQTSAGYVLDNDYYYFYNLAAISTGKLAPDGWRISTSNDWELLKKYIKNSASALKNGSTWDNSSFPYSNIAGFNSVATGYYNGTNYTSNKTQAAYWATTDTGMHDKYFTLSISNNEILEANINNRLGLTIRCLKNTD